jgi:hypothetical protein
MGRVTRNSYGVTRRHMATRVKVFDGRDNELMVVKKLT